MCSLVAVAFQWLYELALAMLKFITCPLHHPLQDCEVEPWRRVKEKLQGIESNCFSETLHCPPDPTLPETKEIWSPPQNTRIQQLPPSPAHRSLPPLSLPATDLLFRAQIIRCRKLLPSALCGSDRDHRTDIETSRNVLKTLLFRSDDSR